jgi:hypothetical protein
VPINARAGVVGTSRDEAGVRGTSFNSFGVYGVSGDPARRIIPQIRAGVFGGAEWLPGVVGYSRQNDGVVAASFTGTALLAVSFYGPSVYSLSGALTGVNGISGTEGPPVPMNIATTAGVVGTSDQRPGVIGTSEALMGVYGFSTGNAGVVGQSANPNSFGGFFAGNVMVTGNLTVVGTKSAAVPFPDGTQRVLYCMESPELWFEDFGAAKLKGGRAVLRLDADFVKVVKVADYHVFATPEGDCRGLYVRRKSAKGFEVRELGGGKSNVAFFYRIVARRKDIKAHRRFAKIDTRLPLPAAAARPPRKRARSAAALRAFVTRLEKEARQRGPKGGPSRTVQTHSRRRIVRPPQPPRPEKK